MNTSIEIVPSPKIDLPLIDLTDLRKAFDDEDKLSASPQDWPPTPTTVMCAEW